MSGSTGSRSVARLLVFIQVFLLVASLFAPVATLATEPSDDPGATPSAEPSAEPAAEPTPAPTPDPTPAPTAEPTAEPTAAPTQAPAPTYAPSGAPSIASDQADYPPGGTVTLTGSNWLAGESVHIFVNDDVGATWSRNVDVIADAGGQISDSFTLPDWFVATYRVTATGTQSGTATTTFTDGTLKVKSDGVRHFDFVSTVFSTTDCTGAGVTDPTNTADTNGENIGIGNTDSVRIVANTNANSPNGTATFSHWLNPDGLTITPNLTTRDICVAGFPSGNKELTGIYTANVAPVADDETISTNEDSAVNTPVTTLLTGDTDANGDTLTVTAVSGATGGSAVLNNNGTPAITTDDFVTFTPTANLCGSGAGGYDYTVSDGALTDTGHVTVNITCVNDAPVADDETISTDEDSAINTSVTTLLTGDTDVDSATLTVTAVSGASGGTAVLNNNGTPAITTDDFVTFTPTANLCGPATGGYDYAVSDGALTDTGQVTVNITCVDDAPVAVDDTKTVLEDAAATTINVLANDTDIDGGPKTITSASDPANGTVVVAGDNLSLTYKPDADYCNNGITTDDFTYTITGGSTATVAVTVTCVDDAPVAVDDTKTVLEDAAATTINVLANDTDIDGGPKTITSASDPANGTVVVAGDNLSLTYKPDADYCNNGITTDDFTYTITGGSTATVAVTVTCVDDAPVAVDDTKTVLEDAAATTINVLANDTDIDGGPKTITSASDPANGTVVVAGDNLSLTYKPDADYCNNGITTDDFTYTITGGSTATVAVTVTCVNDAPSVSLTGPGSVLESAVSEHTYSFDTTDADVGDTFTAGTPDCGTGSYVAASLVFSTSTGDGSFKCKFLDDSPTATASDSTTVSITISDDDTGSGTGSQLVTVYNVDPTVVVTGASPVNESQSLVTYSFDTTDAGTLDTFTHGVPTCGGSGVVVGTVTFDSATGDGSFDCRFADDVGAGASNTSSVSITISDDDTGSGTGSKLVTVNNVNPTVVVTGASPVNESQTAVQYSFDTTDPGTDTFTAGTPTCGASGSYVAASLVFSTSTGDGTFECLFADDNPTGNASNTSTVSITISDDDTGQGTGSKLVTVNNVNPSVSLTGPGSVLESAVSEHTYSFDTTDPGTDTFTAGTPDCGTGSYVAASLVFSTSTGDGSFKCKFLDDSPTATASDSTTVSITISDDDTGQGTGSQLVTVYNVDPTVVVTGASPVNESQSLVTYSFDTTDAGTLDTFTHGVPTCGGSGVVVGTVTFDSATGDGSFDCRFADDVGAGASNTSSVSITISDDDTGSGTGSKLVTVNNVNPTVVVTGASPVNESQTAVLYSFDTTDPGTDTFTAGTPTCGASGSYVAASLVFSTSTGDGTFECLFADDNPTGNASNTSSVSITITDDDTGQGTGSKLVTVNNVNPSVVVTGTSPVNESQTAVQYSFDTTDPGTDTFTAGTPTCGASGSYVAASLVFSTSTGDGTFECLFADDNPTGNASNTSSVSITITDDDTGSGTGSKLVTVNNVNPSVVVTGAASVSESQSLVTYSFDTTDPGTDTFTAGTPSCGTSGVVVGVLTFSTATGDGSFDCRFADDHPTATASDSTTVSITITDDDTGQGTGSKTVTVNNVNPSVSVVVTFNSFTQTATANAWFTDPGWLDSHTATFTWNVPGVQGPVLLTPAANGTGSASNTITLEPGCYPTVSVAVVITDDDTGQGTASGSVVGSADAYDVQFRAPIRDDERNLAKAGSVLPVKVILLKSCPVGTTASDTSANLFLTIAKGAEGTEELDDTNLIVTSVSQADSGQQMRVVDGFYMFNLSTKTLQNNTDYTIRVRLDSTSGPILKKAILRTYK